MPDRLPSLILLVGCWVPAALAGRVAAEIVQRGAKKVRPGAVYTGLASFILASTALWFLINRGALPPYVPGATMDPTFAPPESVRWLAAFSAIVILPVSAIACALAFRLSTRSLSRTAH
jgi:hypothetical protein